MVQPWPAESPEPSSPNARREARFAAAEKSILLMRWGGGRNDAYASHRVRLLDCSAHGLGIVDQQPMQPGDQFVVYLRLEETAMVLYTVRFCVKLDADAAGTGGGYKIGAQLDGFIGKQDSDPDRVLTSLIEQRLV